MTRHLDIHDFGRMGRMMTEEEVMSTDFRGTSCTWVVQTSRA
jgi:hypothetical protein